VILELFINDFVLGWLHFRRYLLNSLASILVLVVLFLGLFLGGTYLAGPAAGFDDRRDILVVGFFMWTLTLISFSGVGSQIAEHARIGVLEQVLLSRYPPVLIYFVQAIAGLAFVLAFNLFILALVVLITGARPSFPPVVAPLLLAIMLGGAGLGFAFGAAAIVLKRVDQLQSFLQFGLIVVVMVPVEEWSAGWQTLKDFLPLTPAASALRDAMARGGDLDPVATAIAMLNSLVYLAIGLAIFARGVRIAKRAGTLASY